MNNWPKEKKQDVSIKIILFLISPFFASLYSLRRIKTKSSYLILFLTFVLFGLVFSVVSGKSESGGYGFDGEFYRSSFERFQYVTNWEFIEGFKEFLSFDEGKKDYYFDTVAFYISRFTDNYHVMFMIVAIIFAFFALKSFRFLTAEKKFDTSLSSYILIYLFTFNQIFNINGFRFWTAAWIAVFCVFQIYRNGNKWYVLLALLTPYFHGTYWIFIGVLVIVQIFKRFDRIWVALFFISFLVSTLAVELIQYFQSYLPTFLSRSVDSYTNADYIEQRQTWSGFGWLPVMFENFVRVYLNIMVVLFIKHSDEIKANPKTKDLYSFLLIWITIFNFFMFVPSLGNRFIILIYPVIAYIWLVHFKDVKYTFILFLLPIVFIWKIIEQIRYYFLVTGYDFYFSNPVLLIYNYILAY
jgi:hypothetical protein